MPTPFVHGRGHRRSELQRDIEALRRLEAQKAKYAAYQDTFRGRNSFSKTDPDATFMHMKEDHMHNAQLMYFQSQYGRKSCSALSLPGIKVPRKNLSSIMTIFVDGCFWHGHDCRNTRPAENAEYWNRKRQKNIEHDAAVTQLFQERGWCVIRIWECELKKKNRAVLDAKLAPVFSWAELHTLITIILPVRYGIQQSL